jgi:outer membrane protein
MHTKQTGPLLLKLLLLSLLVDGSSHLNAQESHQPSLPTAPPAHLLAELDGPVSQQAIQQSPASDPSASGNTSLTRTQAEQMAIKNNPQISVGRLLALAQHQVVRETRSAELPNATTNITAMDAQEASRISAGSLTASRLFEHVGAGVNVTQLITDFGKTNNLIASTKLQEKAQNANALATTEEIVLETDRAFYNALQAQALLQVAQENVDTRQITDKQVSEMTKNRLKSTLDLSFADVNLSQAKLLQLDAKNNADATMATLDELLGLDHAEVFQLADDTGQPEAPAPSVDPLIAIALKQRPDYQALTFNQQSAAKFANAQRDQMLPSISALGTVGTVPIRPSEQYYLNNWWGGVGVNVSVPIFNGFLYPAQAKEASIRTQVAAEQARVLRDRIVRDVNTSWLATNTAFQRVSVTAELLKEANLGLSLAKTRYQMGLSSIVELSQAQYQQTDAAIGNTNAQYEYRLALAALDYQTGTIR